MSAETPTLKQLEYFVCIAELKTFRGAAERLGVSQPTLSAQMYILEQRLDVTLLERSRTGTVLTPAGRDLLVNAREILEGMRGLMDQAGMIRNGPGGTFRIGVSPTVGPYLLPHILPELHEKYATLKLYVRENMPKTLEADLLEGRLDLVLIPLPFSGNKFTTETLFSEPLHLVLPKEHKLSKLKTIKEKHIRGQNMLTLEERYSHYQQVQKACEELGANILRDYQGTSLDALRQMVVMGTGMAFLPSLYIYSEIHSPESLVVTNVEKLKLSRTHVLAWRTNSPNRSFYRQLARTIRKLVKNNLNQVPLDFPAEEK
jgi:LysR family hydrogen peroxide-inducible transcriptional activator